MVTRVTGMNSGMDIDSLVSSLMKAEKAPVDALKQKKTTLTWQTNLYREINTKLSTLKNSLDAMRLSGDWKQNTATSSSSAVSVKADGTSSKISHSIEVVGLATGASTQSAGKVTNDVLKASSNPSTYTIVAGTNDQLKVTLNGVTRTLTLNGSNISDGATLASELQTQIDNMFGKYSDGTSKIQVSAPSGPLELKTIADPSLTNAIAPTVSVSAISGNSGLTNLGLADGQSNRLSSSTTLSSISGLTVPGSFLINGQKISYDSTDTLGSLINKVNNSNAGVNMSYDSAADKFTFTSKDTGNAAVVNLQNSNPADGNFLSFAQLSVGSVSGKDAEVKIDGVTSYRSSNTFTSDGVTYTINQATTAPVTVSVSQDVDSTVSKIKDFIKVYNETVELMNTRVKEVHDRDYKPLTDDQRSGMSETDIENWEKAAKTGLLRNDTIVKSAINGLRELVSTTVGSVSNSNYNALYKIGITTVSYKSGSPQDSGKLQLDEAALTKALNDDPASVIAAFSSQPDGIAQKMYEQVNKSIQDISTKAGGANTALDNVTTDIGFKINKLNSQITTATNKLADKEDYYYKMFATMDSAIGKSNSTLTWLSQFSGK